MQIQTDPRQDKGQLQIVSTVQHPSQHVLTPQQPPQASLGLQLVRVNFSDLVVVPDDGQECQVCDDVSYDRADMVVRRFSTQTRRYSRKKAKPNFPLVETPLFEDRRIRLHEDEDQRVAKAAEE